MKTRDAISDAPRDGRAPNGPDALIDAQGPVGYVCKYTPLELLSAFGLETALIDGEENDFERAETLTHANLCSHAKAVIQQAAAFDAVVLADCCDSLRRAFDVLDGEGSPTLLPMLDVPHESGGCSVSRFAEELVGFAQELARRTGRPFNGFRFAAACRASCDDAPAVGAATGPFYAIMGARVPGAVVEPIQHALDLPVLNLTCGGNRHLEPMPPHASELAAQCTAEEHASRSAQGNAAASVETPCPRSDNLLESTAFRDLMTWYAGALLRLVPCMRMADVAGRRQLTEHPNLHGIVYNTVKFCDYYGFDYERLRTSCDLPLLKIETDYTPMPAGQLSTRLQAFSESLCKEASMTDASRSSSTARPATAVQRLSKRYQKPKAEEGAAAGIRVAHPHGRYVAGIDSGSTTTNMVVLDRDGTVAAQAIVRTGAKAQNGARAAFDTVLQALGATESDFAAIVATGYGRFNIPFATGTVTEITCHGKGAHFLNPDISTIIDIGGQDSKVICLDERGGVENFIMNDKCAAGTGRFLEAMARTLEITLDEISTAGLTWKEDLSISSMCTVFAESEVISLIADNHSEADIVHGLNKSIAARTASMVARAKGRPPYMMTGGVARNRGVVQMLEAKLGAPLFIAGDPDLCGALGAALFALEASRPVVSV